VGALISVVASLCDVPTWELICVKLAPDFAAKYQAYTIDHAKAAGAMQSEIDKKMAETRKFAEMYKNPIFNAAVNDIPRAPACRTRLHTRFGGRSAAQTSGSSGRARDCGRKAVSATGRQVAGARLR